MADPRPKVNLVHFSLTKHFWSSSDVTMTGLPLEVLKVAPLEKSDNALGLHLCTSWHLFALLAA